MRRASALIVGGGPAGSAAAIMLARAGVGPEIFERNIGPRDVVCGGFLGWDAITQLEKLGIDPWLLGARPIELLRLVSRNRIVEVRLPRRAAGISRRTLDQALLEAAADAGAMVRRGIAVRAVDSSHRIRLDTGEQVESAAVFLATGKHDLRGVARELPMATADAAVGFRVSLISSPESSEALRGVVELHLFQGGYAGLLMQDDGTANLCLSVSKLRLKQAGGIDGLAAELLAQLPHLARRMHGPMQGRWNSIAGVRYGWSARHTEAGVFRLGDQAAVIASLAGDGIAMALTSGVEAAAWFLRKGPAGAHEFQSSFARRVQWPLHIASTIRRGVESTTAGGRIMRLLTVAPALASVTARLTRISVRPSLWNRR